MVKTLTRESLSSQLYQHLRTALMEGQYAPGKRLTISSLAEEFGTSITPVREAISRLASERALVVRTASWVQVPDFSSEQVAEISSIRFELEGLAAARAAERITPEQLDKLRALNAEFSAAAAHDPALASVLNRDFHFAVLKLADMPLLESICENMWVLMGPFLRMFHDRMPVRQLSGTEHKHYDVLSALETGNPELSRRAMEEDIRWGQEARRQLEAEWKKGAAVG